MQCVVTINGVTRMHELSAIPEDTNCDEEAMSIGQPGAPHRRTRGLRH
jgi:hypothetical protein